jgi:hypothetical protein
MKSPPRLRKVAAMEKSGGAGWSAMMAMAAVLAAVMSAQSAHAQVGKRNFLEPIITEDPNPSNELELQPGWYQAAGSSNFQFAFSIEKTVTDNFSIEIGDALNRLSSQHEESISGMSDLQILPKWAVYTSVEHEMRLALGGEIFPATGEVKVGAYSHTRAGPMLMFAKGAGDLPEHSGWSYFRPFSLQADGGYLPTWSGPQSGLFFADACLGYQFYYLIDEGISLPISAVLRGVAPFVEFDYQQVGVGKRFGTPPDWRVTPAIGWGNDTYQLTLGAQVGINPTGNANARGAIIALLDVQMDRLWPAIFAKNLL